MSSGSIAVDTALAATKEKALRRVFLFARWQVLAMLNWEVDPDLIAPLAPPGTELDFHYGKTYLSVVGFLFLDTRVLGMAIPGHRNFEEVNLRFYVRRAAGGEVRRGVAFVKEIVPRWAIARVGRMWYNEPYVALPMRHAVTGPAAGMVVGSRESGVGREASEDTTNQLAGTAAHHPSANPQFEAGGRVAYGWRFADHWNSIELTYDGRPTPLVPGSHEEFISEHYWGYCRQRDGTTVEYQVQHPPWNIWKAIAARLDGNAAAFFGAPFAEILSQPPTTAFLADGSPVLVMRSTRIASAGD